MAKSKDFLKSRPSKAVIGVLCLVGAWLVFLRASDTGSLQQYAVLFALIIYGCNRLFSAVKN